MEERMEVLKAEMVDYYHMLSRSGVHDLPASPVLDAHDFPPYLKTLDRCWVQQKEHILRIYRDDIIPDQISSPHVSNADAVVPSQVTSTQAAYSSSTKCADQCDST